MAHNNEGGNIRSFLAEPLPDSELLLLREIAVLRERFPKAYESAKTKTVRVSLYQPEGRTPLQNGMNDYFVQCSIDGVIGETPTLYHIKATLREMDAMLRKEISFLTGQGFNVEYTCCRFA